jgi:hypothetical protein
MIQYFARMVKRFTVLVPGIVIAYFSVRNIFPYFDNHLPLGIAIFVTYVLAAYVLIPAVIRLWRIIHPPKHLPLYCVTPDGFASDPLNIGVIATRHQLIEAMEKAGWYKADHHNLKNVVRETLCTIYGWSYKHAPVSSLFLFGRKQDLAFQVPIGKSPANRHHVRFWAATYDEGDKPLDVHAIHWHNRNAHVRNDKLLWVGAASLDVGVSYIKHNFQLTHMIDPDTNKERRLIVRNLRTTGLIDKVERVKLEEPYRLINRVVNGYLHTDGRMAIVRLKD